MRMLSASCLLVLLVCGKVNAKDRVDDVWDIDKLDRYVIVSVNGMITHGDRLRIRLVPGHCDVGNTFTTVYTYKRGPAVKAIKDMVVPATFRNTNINVRFIHSFKFLMGHRLFVDLGWNRIEVIKQFFAGYDKVTLAFKKDTATFKVSDVMDISENTWSLRGLSDALEKAKDACRKMPSRGKRKQPKEPNATDSIPKPRSS